MGNVPHDSHRQLTRTSYMDNSSLQHCRSYEEVGHGHGSFSCLLHWKCNGSTSFSSKRCAKVYYWPDRLCRDVWYWVCSDVIMAVLLWVLLPWKIESRYGTNHFGFKIFGRTKHERRRLLLLAWRLKNVKKLGVWMGKQTWLITRTSIFSIILGKCQAGVLNRSWQYARRCKFSRVTCNFMVTNLDG